MRNKLFAHAVMVTATVLAACERLDSVGPAADVEAPDPAFAVGGASPVIVANLGIADIAGLGLSGQVTLTRSTQGLWADLAVDGLLPGYAYSVWWAIFNNPQGCDGPCTSFDLRNIVQAQGSLVNGGGFVGTGATVVHTTHLARHDPEGNSVEAGDPRGIRNPYGAEVHLVIRSHGPAEADPDDLLAQISTFAQFCNLPNVGCQNVGASPFAPPGSPGRQGS
ncbi:MAG: hypothetical protein ACREL7_11055 [Longimicrobiales bacterium]